MSTVDFSSSTESKNFSDTTTTESTYTRSETPTLTFSEIDNLNIIDLYVSELKANATKKKYIKNFAEWVLNIDPDYNILKLKYDIQTIFFS